LPYTSYIHLKEKKNRGPLNPELKNRPIKAAQQPPYLLPSSPLVPPPDAPCLSLASGGSSSPARRETGSPKNPGMEEVVSRGERSRGGQICDCEERRGAAPA